MLINHIVYLDVLLSHSHSLTVIIQYNTGGCPAAFRHKFYIQLALPISPEIMDRF